MFQMKSYAYPCLTCFSDKKIDGAVFELDNPTLSLQQPTTNAHI